MRLAVFLIAAAGIGAYVALFVRALIAQAADRRVQRTFAEALDPEQLARLRGYIAEADAHERDMLTLTRDGGSTVIHRRA